MKKRERNYMLRIKGEKLFYKVQDFCEQGGDKNIKKQFFYYFNNGIINQIVTTDSPASAETVTIKLTAQNFNHQPPTPND